MDTCFLNTVFPFHFSIDPAMRLTSFGSSLGKLMGSLELGCDPFERFEFVTQVDGWKQSSKRKTDSAPAVNDMGLTTSGLVSGEETTQTETVSGKPTASTASNFARLYARCGQIFQMKIAEHGILMNGQWAPSSTGLTYLGTPVIKTHYDLSRFGLVAEDFPAYSMAIDRIETSEKLAQAVSQQGRTVSVEQSLGYELTVAADLLVRFNYLGVVQEQHALNPDYLALESDDGSLGRSVYTDFPEVADTIKNAMEQLEENGRPIHVPFVIRREMKTYHFEGRIAKSRKDQFVLVGRDVTDFRAKEERLTYLAQHDALTRLANRGYFEAGIRHYLQEATPFAVMFIDMDDFKAINDQYGHPVGDEVLKVVADRLNACKGLDDTAARLGGDEFGLVIKNGIDPQRVEQLAARVVHSISQPIDLAEVVIQPNASVGVLIPEPGETVEAVYRNVDVAMYNAKAKDTPGQYAIFSSAMLEDYMSNVRLKRDFDRAIQMDELDVHLQPIRSLMTGDWYGFEALVRWDHPTRGMLAPGEFLSLAEESGDIIKIGESVFRSACRGARRLTQHGRELMLTVNVSATQLEDPRFVDMLRGVLAETAWSPRRLTLEIPEQALVGDLERKLALVNGLRGLGIKIAVDDFGLGQASLTYLEELPIDMIKLDRDLMSGLSGEQTNGSRLIESVIRLGHTFGFDVVAEGVERQVQEAIVKSYGCRYAQGFFYCPPTPVAQLGSLPGLELDAGNSPPVPAPKLNQPFAMPASAGEAGGYPGLPQ